MNHGSNQGRIGRSLAEQVHNVSRSSGTATCNHRHLYSTGHLISNVQLVAIANTVRINGVQANFANAQTFGLLGPFNSVKAHGLATATNVHFVAARKLIRNAHELRIHAQNHALATKSLCSIGNNFRVKHSKTIHAHLFGTSQKGLVHIIQITDATTHRKRNKHAVSNLANHFHIARAILCACGNIIKD